MFSVQRFRERVLQGKRGKWPEKLKRQMTLMMVLHAVLAGDAEQAGTERGMEFSAAMKDDLGTMIGKNRRGRLTGQHES